MPSRRKLVELDPLPNDSVFAPYFRRLDAGDYAGADLRLELRNVTTGDDVTLTDADATLSESDTRATYTKAATWTTTNLTVGLWVGLHYVNDSYEGGLTFEVYDRAEETQA